MQVESVETFHGSHEFLGFALIQEIVCIGCDLPYHSEIAMKGLDILNKAGQAALNQDITTGWQLEFQ